jgi:hypothetical protein
LIDCRNKTHAFIVYLYFFRKNFKKSFFFTLIIVDILQKAMQESYPQQETILNFKF